MAHAWAKELWILDARSGAVIRTLAAPAYATGLAVDPGRRLLLVAETAENTVRALSLDDGREVWRRDVLPDPRPLAMAGASLVVGSQGTGELESLGLDDGSSAAPIGPRPGTPIIGGHTEPHARDVMGGKAPRALLWSPRLAKLFVTSIGPNVGPNPQRMEVSMNGGVGVVDLGARRFERHLGFGAGVTEGMAMDEETRPPLRGGHRARAGARRGRRRPWPRATGRPGSPSCGGWPCRLPPASRWPGTPRTTE